MGGEHRSFPILSLLRFTVADDGIDITGVLVDSPCVSKAAGSTQALAERAGGHVDAYGLGPVAMAGEVRSSLVEGGQFFQGKEPFQGQGGIEGRPGMAFGEHEQVTVMKLWLLGVVVHLLSIEESQQFDDRESSPDVANPEISDGVQGLFTDFTSEIGKVFLIFRGDHEGTSLLVT
ncbi:hypothetical protein SDC9_62961 [bioreactor metagenome]|uniref:Uncharacterized protein n=1 Tax=bioreactor metagenome TaxID=1076179 RepID=A0A644XK58_9ZZZZ